MHGHLGDAHVHVDAHCSREQLLPVELVHLGDVVQLEVAVEERNERDADSAREVQEVVVAKSLPG